MNRILLIAAACLVPLYAAGDNVSVTVNGLEAELEKNVRVFLSLATLTERDDLSEAAIRRLHREAPEQIRKALRPFGYYNPDIDRRLEQTGDDTWQATYTIDAGEPVRVASVATEIRGPGQDNPQLRETLASRALAVGEPLRHDRYEALKSALRRAALDQGYLDASFPVREMRVDPEAGTAAIELVLQTGERYAFGEITVDQDALSDELVRRYIGIEAGQPFRQAALLDAQYALQDSGVYRAVAVTAQRERAENLRVPIAITARARDRQKYSFGVGYTTDAGPRVSVGWENRRINTRGHRASVDVRVAAQRTEFAARYSVPIGDPRSERLSWSYEHETEELGDDTESRRDEIGATQTRVLGEWQRNLYLRMTREISEIGTTRSSDLLLLPGITMSRSRSDRPVEPRHGSRVTADLRGSHKALASDTDFLRLRIDTTLVRPLGRGRLLLRGTVGTTLVSEFSRLPASQRFFAGGDRSVRGFALNQLGPRDADGLNIGGEHLLVGSAEVEWPLAGRWSIAAFVDAGNALNDFGNPLEYSAGLGGRLRTPVGVLRLDLAKPVSEGDQTVRLHLSLGADL